MPSRRSGAPEQDPFSIEPEAMSDVTAEFVYDRFLGDGAVLGDLETALQEHAVHWAESVRVVRAPRDQRELDLSSTGWLEAAVVAAARERGVTYRALVERHGAGDERLFGSVELRGATRALVVVVSIDERPLARLGGRLSFGNRIALQIRGSQVEGRRASEWVLGAFEGIAGPTSPTWGAVAAHEEYHAKVMSDGQTLEAVGRDFARFLPALFTAKLLRASLRRAHRARSATRNLGRTSSIGRRWRATDCQRRPVRLEHARTAVPRAGRHRSPWGPVLLLQGAWAFRTPLATLACRLSPARKRSNGLVPPENLENRTATASRCGA
jgi:hypothetical protein